MTGPLSGVRVVDCSRGLAGTKLTWMLADYGSDVIWVEPPGGDPWREDLRVEYAVFNRNKRSVELDLKTEEGRESLRRLLATADVFVESWRPGVAERLGLDYAQLHARFPGLVCCSISGFGPGHPDADLPGHDALVHAVGGAMASPRRRDRPVFLGLPTASAGASYMAMIGVLAALYRRADDMWGREVEVSLLDGLLAYYAQNWGYSDTAATLEQVGRMRMIGGVHRCADGAYLGISTFGIGAFDRFTEAMGIAGKFEGKDLGVSAMMTPAEAGVVAHELPRIFATEPSDVWIDRLKAADVAVIPCLQQTEVFDYPQTRHNEMVVEIVDPTLGTLQQVAAPIKFAGTPVGAPRPAPSPGQHTAEVLAEVDSGAARTRPEPRGPIDERPLLDGVRILDLGHWYAGPYSSRLLADLGADVIKLESPAGDGMRGFERPFATAQAGKRAIAADLKDADLFALRDGLMRWADVVHHNLRSGVAKRLVLDYDDVRARNPDVVYLNAPGWGSSGPDEFRKSFAPLMSGLVGAAYEICGAGNPPEPPTANEDSGAGMLGGVALLLGLVSRKLHGAGQYLELPQLNSAISDVAFIARRPDGSVLGANTLDAKQLGTGPLNRLYRTDGGWLCLAATTDDEVRALGGVLGTSLVDDPRFATREARAAHAEDLIDLLADAFASRVHRQVLDELRRAGVPAVAAAVDNNRAFMDDPLNLDLGRVAELRHPRFGRVREPGVMVRVSGASVAAHRPAPDFGEHTDEILGEHGYSRDKIEQLRARRTVV